MKKMYQYISIERLGEMVCMCERGVGCYHVISSLQS